MAALARGGNVILYVDRQQNGGRHDLTFSMNEQGNLGQGDIEDRPPRSGVGNREKPAELAIGALRVRRRKPIGAAPSRGGVAVPVEVDDAASVAGLSRQRGRGSDLVAEVVHRRITRRWG